MVQAAAEAIEFIGEAGLAEKYGEEMIDWGEEEIIEGVEWVEKEIGASSSTSKKIRKILNHPKKKKIQVPKWNLRKRYPKSKRPGYFMSHPYEHYFLNRENLISRMRVVNTQLFTPNYQGGGKIGWWYLTYNAFGTAITSRYNFYNIISARVTFICYKTGLDPAILGNVPFVVLWYNPSIAVIPTTDYEAMNCKNSKLFPIGGQDWNSQDSTFNFTPICNRQPPCSLPAGAGDFGCIQSYTNAWTSVNPGTYGLIYIDMDCVFSK